MNVTKQQQLEWLAKNKSDFNFDVVIMSAHDIGQMADIWDDSHYKVTKKEWQQERDKISSKPEVDSSWHESRELPHVGAPIELWFGGSFAYNCEFICVRGMSYIVWNLDADRPDCADIMNSEFRPLRTEREKAIDELNALVGDIEKYPTWRDAIAAIVDAGYHK